MVEGLRLMCILAHPDDETLGMGGTLAHYAAQGVETHVLTATRGEAGRYGDGSDHPGPEELGRIRERELRAAAAELGVHGVELLGYPDGEVDRADPGEAVGRIAERLERVRPQVVLTFDPFGAYGHPDHIAVSQLATAAVTVAGSVSKLYYMAWNEARWGAYQAAFKELVSVVDGVKRRVRPWPDWAVTTRIDTSGQWKTVWRAVRCHRSQIAVYGRLAELDEEHHRGLWGAQTFYRAMSTVNGGREPEHDLFEGLR